MQSGDMNLNTAGNAVFFIIREKFISKDEVVFYQR